MPESRPCPATAEIAKAGSTAILIQCGLVWPHLDRDHEFTFAWPVNPDDLTLGRLEEDLDG